MDQESVNPLVPAVYDVTWSVLVAVLVLVPLVVFVVGAVSVLRSPRYTGGGKLLWVVALWALPVVGTVVWFAAGRTARLRTDVP